MRLGRPEQHQTGARGGAQLDPRVGAGGLEDARRRSGAAPRCRAPLPAAACAARTSPTSATGSRSSTRSRAACSASMSALLLGARVAERHAHHEAVELGLGQRDRCPRTRPGSGWRRRGRGAPARACAVDRDVALLHALEQPRLRLRRRPVDLVDEHDVREHRPGTELEAVLALVEDVRPDHVGGQQVGGALHARVLGVDRARERAGQRRLADPRVVLDQDVALGQQRDEHVAEHLLGGLDRPRDVVAQASAQLRDLRGIELRDGRHVPPW